MEVAATLMTNLAAVFGGPMQLIGSGAPLAVGASQSLFSGSGLMSLLQGGATVLSVMGGLRAAQEQAAAREGQAADARLEAAMEGTRGIERRTQIQRQMLEDLGARDVAYAASGVDLSFGTPASARNDAVADANAALSTDAETENIRRNRLLTRSAMYRSMAEDARAGGTLRAISGGMSMLADIGRRR